jgi:DNA-binding transcriptional LysR family regulator
MLTSHDMLTFIRVAEGGSFAAAAETLGLSPSAVSKLVSRAEDRLGVRLLTRTTRKLALTDEGSLYLARARDIVAAIEAAEEEISESAARPSGRLTINTGTAFARHQLAPLLSRFLVRYPDITVDFGVTDRQVNLLDEHVDVAIRTGPVSDASLIVRKLGQARRRICASPAYLAKYGEPRTPADLASHHCIAVSCLGELAHWPFTTPEGINRMAIKPKLTCDSADVVLEMGLAGLGIFRLGDFMLDEHLRNGDLVELLPHTHTSETFDISLVMLPGRNRVPRVRVFIDFMVEEFGRAARM